MEKGPDAKSDSSSDDSVLEKLTLKVIAVERKYGHELRNVTADRRSEIRDLVEQFAKASE